MRKFTLLSLLLILSTACSPEKAPEVVAEVQATETLQPSETFKIHLIQQLV